MEMTKNDTLMKYFFREGTNHEHFFVESPYTTYYFIYSIFFYVFALFRILSYRVILVTECRRIYAGHRFVKHSWGSYGTQSSRSKYHR